MVSVQIEQNEDEYTRMYGDYWLFCLRRRYNNKFLGIVFTGVGTATTLLVLAHPDSMLFSLVSAFWVVFVAIVIIGLFDFFRYTLYLVKVKKFFEEHESELSYELKFNEQKIVFYAESPEGVGWNFFMFYHANEKDIYLFDKKRALKTILSKNSMDEEAFKSFVGFAKSNLRLLK